MPSLFSNLWTFTVWSRLSARLPRLFALRFTLSIDTPFLCHCVSQEEDWICLQLQLSHKISRLLFLLISSRCATSWPPSPSHFIPKLWSSSLFFLSFLLWFHCFTYQHLHLWSLFFSWCTFSYGDSSSLLVTLISSLPSSHHMYIFFLWLFATHHLWIPMCVCFYACFYDLCQIATVNTALFVLIYCTQSNRFVGFAM